VSDGDRRGVAPPLGGFLGAAPSGPIVAREEEVSRLLSLLDEVVRGEGRLVMLAGEPGVGKTRLAQEVTVGGRARGFQVASGRCYEPERSVPYYPFLEVLTVLSEGVPAGLRAEAPRRWPYLERLLPDRPREVSGSEMGAQDVQQRLFWAVSGFLQAAAESAPVAVLLDDLHWADESSLRLLQHVARQTRGSRVLLVGTYRDVEVGRQNPLERLLRDLHRDGMLEEMTVRRLEEEGTGALAAAVLGTTEVPGELAQLVHAHTDGHPFFTQEVMRALVERGDVFLRDGNWDRWAMEDIEVPQSVRSAIGERVSRLSDQTQTVLHEASVLGQAFGFEELWRMGKRSEEEVEEALEEVLTAMLIRVSGRDEYSFNHALTQQTLYAELTPRRRRRLHAAAGEALEQLPERERRRRAAQIARHFLEADDRERALPFAMLAGDEAEAVYAHDEAEQQFRIAVELARDGHDQAREKQRRCGSLAGSSGRQASMTRRWRHSSRRERCAGRPATSRVKHALPNRLPGSTI
jgi:predicted ATPase